jgi:hypothetical protein
MFSFAKRSEVSLLVVLAALALTVSPVCGQSFSMRLRQGMMSQQSFLNPAMMNRAASVAPTAPSGNQSNNGFMNSNRFGSPLTVVGTPAAPFYANPYGVSPMLGQYAPLYANPYISSNVNSYTRPYGNLYGSPYGGMGGNGPQDGYPVTEQQMKEQVRADRSGNSRKSLDEGLYERAQTPSAEDERQNSQQRQLNRSLNNPSASEIWSGMALNAILADLRKLPTPRGPSDLLAVPLPLDDEGIQQINVATAAGGIGWLKNGGRFSWPAVLQGPEFEPERKRLAAHVANAIDQAKRNGQVDYDSMRQMIIDSDRLRAPSGEGARPVSSSVYRSDAFSRSARPVRESAKAARCGESLHGEIRAPGQDRGRACRSYDGARAGVRPALRGEEEAYELLHQALVNYDRAAHQHAVQE